MADVTVPPDHRMVFIVGRGRSGTTLLRTLLDAHPSISVAPEGLFIMNLMGARSTAHWTDHRVRRFGRRMFLEERMRRWSVERNDLEKRWLSLPPDAGFARRCAEVYEAHADAAGKNPGRLLGDKNPHFSLFVDELLDAFPQARFVHLVRDYRDNVASYRNVRFDLTNIAALGYRWRRYNEIVQDAAERFPARFLRMRFEDLVTDPVSSLDELGQFLGIDWDSSALMSDRATQSLPDWHRNVSGPVDRHRANQWQDMLTPAEVALLDSICQPLGTEFGYLPVSDGKTSMAGWGTALGWTVTTLERLLFRFPLTPRILVIKAYRRLTGNRIA